MGRGNTVSALAWLTLVPATPFPDATSDFDEALRIAREIGLAPCQAWGYYSLGMLHMMQGHFSHALKDILGSLRIASEIGHREYIVGAQFALGILYAELFAPVQALEHLEGALTLARELRSPTWIHIISGALAGVYLTLHEQSSAQACLETAISPQLPMDTLGNRYCWIRWAELALAQGDPTLTLEITERLIESAPGMSPRRVITYLWKLKAEALVATGCKDDARSLLHAALENAQATGERFLLWRVFAGLGQLYHSLGNQGEAEKEIATAYAIIDKLAANIYEEKLKASFQQGAYRITKMLL
jgi:tetratricopeptide (TPR) repeat protein